MSGTDLVLRIGMGTPASLDPATCADHDGALVLGLLADPLVDFEPATGRLRPAAALGWRVDPDGLRVRFELRPGVLFHSGREVTAEDYVYALSRVVRPSTGSQIAYHLSVIDGFEDVRSGRTDALSGVRAMGPRHLEVRLTRPFHEIAAVFSLRVTTAVPADGGLAFTGPYRIDPARSRTGVVALERFPGYYGANEAHPYGGSGWSDRIEFHVVDDEDTAFDAWRSGRLDVVEIAGPRAADARSESGYRLTPCASLTYLGFPVAMAPFDDPAVRRAVAMGLDRRALCEAVGEGEFTLAHAMVPPWMMGDQLPVNTLEFDPARARAELAALGVRPERPVPLVYDGEKGHDLWITLIAGQLRTNLGWDTEIRSLPRPEYLRWLDKSDALFRATWVSDYPSVDTVLFPLFHSDSVGGGGNYAGYRDPAVDALIDSARAEADPAARAARYREAEAAVCADLPVLPLWYGTMRHLIADGVVPPGVTPVDLFGAPVPRALGRSQP